jgi:DNA repair protein RadC
MKLLQDSKITIEQPEDIAKIFQDLLKLEDAIDREKEHFYVCHLDSRHRINMVELVAIGTINVTITHPRETFRRAVTEGSYSIIVAHNHPSGDVTPSDDDLLTTRKLHEAGTVLGIPLLDHIIFAKDTFFSFKRNKTQHTGNTI